MKNVIALTRYLKLLMKNVKNRNKSTIANFFQPLTNLQNAEQIWAGYIKNVFKLSCPQINVNNHANDPKIQLQ